jgi:long-chain acyl-CoA synthetase
MLPEKKFEWNKCTEEDCPIFSYTSGTTGDSKGVKLTHRNLITACSEIMDVFLLGPTDASISYLPYPHSFE